LKAPKPLPDGLAGLDRPAIMGICNVTPDSFSDGGRWVGTDAAVAHAEGLLANGADIVDVGGESTRPGAGRVSSEEELSRVIPVVKRLAAAGAAVSVDTMRASVARAAAESGAVIINDVSGGLADPSMLATMAQTGLVSVLMHWRGHSTTMDRRDHYTNPAAQVAAELLARAQAALDAGVARDAIVLDPGLGFAKVGQTNWQVLAGLDQLSNLGYPVLVGASRKRFLAAELEGPSDWDRLDGATAALTALLAMAGVWSIRVHSPQVSRDAAALGRAWRVATAKWPPRGHDGHHGPGAR
jgi:dihydropteroate synthase